MENAVQQDKYRLMTESPVRPLVCRMAVPTIISMLVTSFYNMADTFFVGKIESASATAAVGVVFPLMSIIQATGFFFGHGSGNFISRALGRQENESAEKMAAVGFFSALIAGVFIMTFGLIFLEPLARLLGSTDSILPYACDYMRWILIGAPYMTASLVLNNQLRFQGNAFYSMIGLTVGAVINIALDPLLIFTLNMGIGGAALATIFSQLISFVLLWIGTRQAGSISIRLKNFRPTRSHYGVIVNGGSPSLFRQGLNSVATIFLNVAAGVYGDAAIAGMSIVTRIMQFANSCLIGFGQGFQPVCGFNYGAKKYRRVKEAFWFCVKLSTVVLLALAAAGYAFAPQIVRVFRTDDAVVSVGVAALRMQCITFPLAAWIVMSNMMSQTIGKAVRASFLAMARQGLFFIPAVLILPKFLGIFGVEISQAVADAVSFLFSIPLQVSLLRELRED